MGYDSFDLPPKVRGVESLALGVIRMMIYDCDYRGDGDDDALDGRRRRKIELHIYVDAWRGRRM